jgi:hypothetical protein
MIDPLDYIDPDEGRPGAFFATALPCESCGAPTFMGRVWNAEHQIWIAQDCACNVPSEPTCPLLIPALTQAVTVRQVCRVIREHRRTCHLCKGVVEITQPKKTHREPARVEREAA